jgi:hypothetical protein
MEQATRKDYEKKTFLSLASLVFKGDKKCRENLSSLEQDQCDKKLPRWQHLEQMLHSHCCSL